MSGLRKILIYYYYKHKKISVFSQKKLYNSNYYLYEGVKNLIFFTSNYNNKEKKKYEK